MGATIDALRELQSIELQIVDIQKQMGRKARVVAAQEKKLDGLRKQIATAEAESTRVQMDLDAADVDLKARQSSIQKLREHLNSVKTNKEYAAVLAQLNNEKADTTRIETRAMELMGDVETRKGAIQELRDAESREAGRLDELNDQAQQTEKSYSGHLDALLEKREGAAGRLENTTVTQFTRLSERYDGEAMAQLERTHPRRDEYICTGCYLSLSAEVANSLMTRDEVVTCKNCGRILYYEKE